jgi:hypothetical protein
MMPMTSGGSVADSSATVSSASVNGDPDTSSEVADITPVLGAPQVANAVASSAAFALDLNQPASVPTLVAKTKTGRAIEFTSKMSIDANGAGGWWREVKAADQPVKDGSTTTARFAHGESLNPGKIPFIALPSDFDRTYPDVRMGDYVAVTYGARTVYAIVGDNGPKGVVGEGSIALARSLKIHSDPNTGGVRSGVTYVILPGSKDAALPRTAAAIQARGQDLFQQAGIPPI